MISILEQQKINEKYKTQSTFMFSNQFNDQNKK